MVSYHLSQQYPHAQFLQIEMSIKPKTHKFKLKLPEWRPGRYQLGNFSKNIRNLEVRDQSGNQCPTQKTNRHTWEITCKDSICSIQYEVYTSVIDGGSTYVDETHWYLNFINCLLYDPQQMKIEHQVRLAIPDEWQIACGLKDQSKSIHAKSFYDLVDSPLLAGKNLINLKYQLQGIDFHLWFRGDLKIDDPTRIIEDFQKFTQTQLEMMQEFENDSYHFLFQIPNEKAYHGVEHLNSTCIVLGPANEFHQEAFYDNFLGISSHELFHYWNIIRIRPKEMVPYDFTKENYFSTGYVAEGVTTYYGDIFLVRSGVRSVEWYLNELNKLFKRHFENYGRFNSSVAASSMDLWVDGYDAGIPDKKVSIYVKGAMIALILDLSIMLETDGKQSLDDVIRLLWTDFYKKGIGYSAEDYLRCAEQIIGRDLSDYASKYITGTAPVENELQNLLLNFGFELKPVSNELALTSLMGVKINEKIIASIAPGSPGEKIFRRGDEIVSWNHQTFTSANELASIDVEKEYLVHFYRSGKLEKRVIKAELGEDYYYTFEVKTKKELTNDQKRLREKWLSR